jgi:selenocysteine lyase/cysteine desulfurase
MDIQKIRLDFPALWKKWNNKYPIYFDNACMTLKPKIGRASCRERVS